MAQQVCSGAQMMCSFGTGPSTLNILPTALVNAGGNPAATIMDNKPMMNISPFIMCTSIANPQVATATAAALGTLTPMPCIPNTVAPWTPGSPTVMVGGNPALNSTCTLNCLWAGVITITTPGQFTVNVP